jgi:hypothetical protein
MRSTRNRGDAWVSRPSELVWLAPKPSGGGVAVAYLEAEDPEQALGELAGSNAPFDLWYGAEMRRLFGFNLARLPRIAGSELLFSRGEASSEGEQELPNPGPTFGNVRNDWDVLLNANGMTRDGDAYVNEPDEDSDVTLSLFVRTSSGDINLRLAE